MNTNIRILILLFTILLSSCQKREWNNPFDADCPKELFTPTNFKAIQTGNQVTLNWIQTDTNISGFVIERSVAGDVWTSVATPDKSVTTWADTNLTGGKVHEYRIFAKAGSNTSDQLTAQVTPLFASTITTSGITKLLSTSAILGGNITNSGGATVTARGVCYSTTNNPTIINSKTADGSGTGTFTSTITGLASNTTYYARAYATNSTSTAYGNEIIFKTYFGEVTDIDGNVYPTVKIGTQTWMAENLKTTKYNDGTAIVNVTENTYWAGLTTGAYCWYNNDINYKNTYGALYNWYAANTNKLAPIGWHVPTDAEWTTLTTFLGESAGTKMKTTSGWSSINGSNSSGFSGLPGGLRYGDGTFYHLGNYGFWWSSTYGGTVGDWSGADGSWSRCLYNEFNYLGGINYYVKSGLSVRCLLGTLNPPTVSTATINNLTTSTASCGGTITNDGGTAITARGVCWNTSPNPTVANSKTSEAIGTGTGSFTSNLTGLTANTNYYIRAYAINSVGTAYGNEVSFKTSLALSLATLTTTTPVSITSTSATLGGNVTTDGNATVTERGVCYSTSANPTTSNSKMTIGNGTGSFSQAVTGLTVNTTYYVRAYAINSQGTAYGNEQTFKTSLALSLASLTTSTPINLTSTSATLGGNITSDGNATVTECGICYSTSTNPTTSNTKLAIGSGTGSFSNTVTGLTANTTYYVRAYAINSQGTAYGNEVSFKTDNETVTDIDGNVYHTVTIGTQIWMVENLKTTKYNDGSPIPNLTVNSSWQSNSTGAFCWYNNDINNKEIYGGLYNWYAVNTNKLAPIGWHVPTDAEWTILVNYLGGENIAGGKLKQIGTDYWNSPNLDGTNEIGFTALPGGDRYSNGLFQYINVWGYWWSSTSNGINPSAWNYSISTNYSSISRSVPIKWFGYSVRCVRD